MKEEGEEAEEMEGMEDLTDKEMGQKIETSMGTITEIDQDQEIMTSKTEVMEEEGEVEVEEEEMEEEIDQRVVSIVETMVISQDSVHNVNDC